MPGRRTTKLLSHSAESSQLACMKAVSKSACLTTYAVTDVTSFILSTDAVMLTCTSCHMLGRWTTTCPVILARSCSQSVSSCVAVVLAGARSSLSCCVSVARVSAMSYANTKHRLMIIQWYFECDSTEMPAKHAEKVGYSLQGICRLCFPHTVTSA